MLSDYADIHAHLREGQQPRPDTLYSIMPGQWAPRLPEAHYSIGLHPMFVADEADAEAQWALLQKVLEADARIEALGECGLDRRSSLDTALQRQILQWHAEEALRRRWPLIIHCVGRWDDLIDVLRPYLAQGLEAAVHGFRGKPQLARQLLGAGLHLSYGERYNPEAKAQTPPDMLHHDSD